MKRLILLMFLICGLTACYPLSESSELEKMVAQIEQALPEGVDKQFETEAMAFTFVDEEGNELVYYICKTTFYAADPAEVTGLHTKAISAIFDVENAVCLKEFETSGHPAAIYQLGDRHYACFTSTPEASGVLEYDPEVVTEQEAILVIRSIFEGPDVAKELDP